MNENTLKRIHNHFVNDPKDRRGSFVDVVESQLENIKDENERTKFLLNVLPFIKQYSVEQQEICVPVLASYEDNNTLNKCINEHSTIQKGKVYRDFMKKCFDVIIKDGDSSENTDPSNSCSQISQQCPECNQNCFVYIMNESSIACTNCGYSTFYQDFSLSYYNNHTMNNGEFVCQFAYKRINHFREWLTQIQGKENTVIPSNLVIQIMKELKQERTNDVNDITYDKIKKYLKKNGLSKYYEHIPIIINKICRRDKLSISTETERVLIDKFGEIQAPFERHRPRGRKNFLSYSYTLHKLCQLIGRNDLLPMFPLLKSRTKLYVQDDTWEKICNDLGWEFIPSL